MLCKGHVTSVVWQQNILIVVASLLKLLPVPADSSPLLVPSPGTKYAGACQSSLAMTHAAAVNGSESSGELCDAPLPSRRYAAASDPPASNSYIWWFPKRVKLLVMQKPLNKSVPWI